MFDVVHFGFPRGFTAPGEVGGRQTCDSDAWNLPSQRSNQAPGSILEDFSGFWRCLHPKQDQKGMSQFLLLCKPCMELGWMLLWISILLELYFVAMAMNGDKPNQTILSLDRGFSGGSCGGCKVEVASGIISKRIGFAMALHHRPVFALCLRQVPHNYSCCAVSIFLKPYSQRFPYYISTHISWCFHLLRHHSPGISPIDDRAGVAARIGWNETAQQVLLGLGLVALMGSTWGFYIAWGSPKWLV